MQIIRMHKQENNFTVLLTMSEKNFEESSSFICNEADSDHVILKTLKIDIHIPENLFAAEYIPLYAIPNIEEIIILSDALTIHQEI